MNYQEVLSLYWEALEKGALEDGAPLGKYMSPTSFDAFENLNYLDRDMTASRFDDPGYVEYLTAMKEVPTGAAPFSIAASYEPFEGREDLVNIGGIQFSNLSELSGLTSELGGVFQTYRLENGGTAFRGMNMFGITAACENPELAWEFLKFMISQKDFLTSSICMGTRIETTENCMEATCQFIGETSKPCAMLTIKTKLSLKQRTS